MRKYILCIAAAMAAALNAADAHDENQIYLKPAQSAREAVYVGNDTYGATIYGTFPDEKVVLNINAGDDGAGAGGDHRAFRPLAELTVHHSVPVNNRVVKYERGLDADVQTGFTDMTLTSGRIREDFYASGAPDSVIVVQYSDEVPLLCTIVLSSEFADEVKSFDDQIVMTGRIPDASGKGSGTDFATILKVLPGDGMIVTNPDASLTLNYVKGPKLIISTVRGGAPVSDRVLPDKGNAAVDLARLRVFRASLKMGEGLDRYRLTADVPEPAYTAVSTEVKEQPDGALYADVVATDSIGIPRVVLRTAPGRIEFLPEFRSTGKEGLAEDVSALGCFDISFRWENGDVTGGNITYRAKDYMPSETSVELVLNGEVHKVDFTDGETVPIENFVDLVRPFIQ